MGNIWGNKRMGKAGQPWRQRATWPLSGTNLAVANSRKSGKLAMQGHHISQLMDFGRSLFYGRHTAKIVKPPVSRAFQRGVFAARMGMERDDNPYPFGTHGYIDWIDGYESSVEVGQAMDLD
ncbi:hypothetical protein EN792_037260 [Mesorhizobium sp. M00.F.Ca.ET.149.01.1.1]|nr:hypothetical protein EN792_037260 [Mesorhizobium sp. M00.F.Ca.ET.149.01.1.1]